VREAPRAASLTACAATRAAAKAAGELLHVTTGSYPTSFTAMTNASPPVLEPGVNTTVTDTTIEGQGWLLQLSGGGSTPPKLICVNTLQD
jgi:hypothetical protein